MGEPSRPWEIRFWRKRPDQGGLLDPRRRLEEIYIKAWNSLDLEEEMKKVFPQARLAVLGRSGAGKTTLIRLIVGPGAAGLQKNIAHGTAGTQDINDEWRCSDSELPLLIHDSNGIDLNGPERVHTIKTFLDKHQQSSDHSQRIHLIWYVISAVDRRFLDDGDLLRLVCSYEIPIVLVITHSDCVVQGKEFVTDGLLDKLLAGVPDKTSVKQHMVRVGNDVRPENGQLIEHDVDKEALQRLHMTTKKLIGSKRRYVWAAAQARDMLEKLEASAALTVYYVRAAMFSAVVASIPLVEHTKLIYMFIKILKSLCMIWRVPPNLKIVLSNDVARPEGVKSLLGDLLMSTVAATGLVTTVTATVLTGGVAFPSILAWLVSYGVAVGSRSSRALLTGYSCVILGCILYVKVNQKTSQMWDAEKTIEEYNILCNEFAESKYQDELPKNVAKCFSSWDTLFRGKRQSGKIKSQIVDFYKEMLKSSPRSLFSLMEKDKVTQEAGNSNSGYDENSDAGYDENSDAGYDENSDAGYGEE